MIVESSNFIDLDRSVTDLVVELRNEPDSRYILGICGYPGSGKSTMADLINKKIQTVYGANASIVVPMDGFHYSDDELRGMGVQHLKGIPESFNAGGFVELVSNIQKEPHSVIYAPVFDRSSESTIENALEIRPEHKLVIVEGNYLLLERKPWSELKQYFKQVWFLEVPQAVLKERLVQRHEAGGRSKEAAWEKVLSTDLPNAELIAGSKQKADKIFNFESC